MRAVLALAAAGLALGGCLVTGPAQPRIEPSQFSPHGRFSAFPLEQAFALCRHEAIAAGHLAAASGLPGTLPTLYGPPPGVIQRAVESMVTCMDARGYAWRGR